jgi:predicted Zn-dependent peptidase
LGNKDFFGIYYLERNRQFCENELIKEKERMLRFFREFKRADFKEIVNNFIELIKLEYVSSSNSPVEAVEYEVHRLVDPDNITVDDLPILKKLSIKDLERVMAQYFNKPPKAWICVNNSETEER